MEALLQWLCEYQDNAHLVIFGLLMIAGFSLPISEDLLLIASGYLASTVMPERTFHLFMAVFLGSYFSDGIAYGLGRAFGKKIYAMRWFARAKRENLQAFCAKHGFWALMIGRCIPFGLRNGIFMTAGVGRMHFGKFLLGDALACFVFSAALFSLAYFCGKNIEMLSTYVQQAGIFILFTLLATVLFFWIRRRQRKRKPSEMSL